MIQSIQYRKSTFLASREWLSLPWSETGKDIYQQLVDKGFALAAMLERIDNAGLTKESINISMLSQILGGLSGLDEELNLWYHDILNESPSAPYWHAQSISHSWHPREAAESCTFPPFAFRTPKLASTIVKYWGLRIILSNTIALACEHILSMNPQIPETSSSSTSPQTIQDLCSMSLRLLETHAGSYRLELATNIVRSMPYCLDDKMGLMSAQKSLFAMRAALFALQGHPGEELKWCQAIYQELDSKKGLRYAREIAKLNGKFSAAGRDKPPHS